MGLGQGFCSPTGLCLLKLWLPLTFLIKDLQISFSLSCKEFTLFSLAWEGWGRFPVAPWDGEEIQERKGASRRWGVQLNKRVGVACCCQCQKGEQADGLWGSPRESRGQGACWEAQVTGSGSKGSWARAADPQGQRAGAEGRVQHWGGGQATSLTT